MWEKGFVREVWCDGRGAARLDNTWDREIFLCERRVTVICCVVAVCRGGFRLCVSAKADGFGWTFATDVKLAKFAVSCCRIQARRLPLPMGKAVRLRGAKSKPFTTTPSRAFVTMPHYPAPSTIRRNPSSRCNNIQPPHHDELAAMNKP